MGLQCVDLVTLACRPRPPTRGEGDGSAGGSYTNLAACGLKRSKGSKEFGVCWREAGVCWRAVGVLRREVGVCLACGWRDALRTV